MKIKSKLLFVLTLFLLIACLGLLGCNEKDQLYVVSIIQTQNDELGASYIVTYSDGSTSILQANERDITIDDIYEKYLELNPNATYEEFLKNVLTVNVSNNTTSINKALKSSAKIYTEFTQNYRLTPFQTTIETAIYLGSAVVYKIDEEYTYFITNYHVVYNYSATEQDKIAKKIVVYLYGSEGEPVSTNAQGSDGCTIYDYGAYAIDCEYVGGSITADIAIVKAKNSDVNKINDDVLAIDFADGYNVGETAIAIGNPEGEGLSVTEGIISVDNENIALAIDGVARYYRSIRIDTSIYSGSSGGGLYNVNGKLIGITNAGDGEDQNVNYAIPVEIVKASVENIMFYAQRGEKNAKKITFGITVESRNSKYVYDQAYGQGKIVEEVYIVSTLDGSISKQLGLEAGDKITCIIINGTNYLIDRYFEISDLLLKVKSGDVIAINYERDGANAKSIDYLVTDEDLSIIA